MGPGLVLSADFDAQTSKRGVLCLNLDLPDDLGRLARERKASVSCTRPERKARLSHLDDRSVLHHLARHATGSVCGGRLDRWFLLEDRSLVEVAARRSCYLLRARWGSRPTLLRALGRPGDGRIGRVGCGKRGCISFTARSRRSKEPTTRVGGRGRCRLRRRLDGLALRARDRLSDGKRIGRVSCRKTRWMSFGPREGGRRTHEESQREM